MSSKKKISLIAHKLLNNHSSSMLLSPGAAATVSAPFSTFPLCTLPSEATPTVIAPPLVSSASAAPCAVSVSIFFAQLAFVLKKKQFEKVQLAEGF